MLRKGFSIIEFIVASTLTLGVLMASGTALSSTERGMANSRSVDTGAAIGVSVLEQTALFNCQRTTDLSTTTLRPLAIVCASVYGEGNAATSSSAGDFIYKKIVNGTDFIVEVSSAWLYSKTSQTQSGLTPSNSGNSGSSPATCPSVQASYSAFRQPSILSREVTVSWSTARNGYVSRKYISLESHYREDKDNPKGSLIIQVPQGYYAVLKSTTNLSDDKPVARKSVCTTVTGGAEILFPYLAPGDYTYSVFPILSSQDILSAQNRLDTFKSTILSPSLPVTVSSSTNKICTNTGVCS